MPPLPAKLIGRDCAGGLSRIGPPWPIWRPHQARDLLLGMVRELGAGLDQHLDGTARLAAELGQVSGLNAEELDITVRAAELHDIGKMAIPEQILTKAGPP